MTRDEVKLLLLKTTGLYPNFKIDDLTLTIDAWHSVLQFDDPQLINDALTVYCRTSNSGFAPSVAQLHGLIAKASVPDIDEGEVKTILTLASRNANYGSEEEFKKMDPILQKAVGSPTVIRSWGILEQEQLEYEFNRIIRSYKVILEQRRTEVSMQGAPALDMMARNMIRTQEERRCQIATI